MDNTILSKIPVSAVMEFNGLKEEEAIRAWHQKWTPYLAGYVIERIIDQYKKEGKIQEKIQTQKDIVDDKLINIEQS